MNNHHDIKKLSNSVSKFVVAMEGNVSKKTNDLIFIKSSGSYLSKLDDNEIVCYDFYENQKSNFSKRGSMELGFHTYLLGFENNNYISHTHPVNTLKILCGKFSKLFAKKRLFPDQVIFNGHKSCLVPYVKPGKDLTIEIKKNVEKFIEKEKYFPKLILLKNHGIITCGKTVDECIVSTEICEKSAEIFLQNTNKSNFLSKKDIKDLLIDENEKYRKNRLL